MNNEPLEREPIDRVRARLEALLNHTAPFISPDRLASMAMARSREASARRGFKTRTRVTLSGRSPTSRSSSKPGYTVRGSEPGGDPDRVHLEYDPTGATVQ